MSSCIEKTSGVIIKIITILSILVFATVSIINLVGTTYIDTTLNRFKEYANFQLDNYLLTILLLALFFVIMIGIDYKWGFEKFNTKRLKNIALIYVIALGFVWILAVRGRPINDQVIVQRSAAQFLEGDYKALKHGEYLAIFPFQLGAVFLFEAIYCIFGGGNFISIMFLNVMAVAGIFSMLFRIIKELTQNKKVWNFYWIMVFWCFPMVFYGFFVYGTVFGLFFALIGIYLAMKYYRTFKIRYIVGSFLGFGGAIIAKSNYRIFLLGTVLVLMFAFIKDKKFKCLVVPCILLLTLFAQKPITLFYENVSGMQIEEGAPISLYIAMGLQDGDKENGCGAAGWYNAYNIKTFKATGYNAEEADKLAKENISERLAEFASNPLKLGGFLGEKISTQWAEPTFQTFWMIEGWNNHDKQTAVVESFLDGDINKVLIKIMKLYLLLVWVGNLIYLIINYKKMDIWKLLLSVIVIGGFIFHTMSEGKALYVMPYFAISLVSGVQGILWMIEKVESMLKKYAHH